VHSKVKTEASLRLHYKSLAEWLHLHHILSERVRKLEHLKQRIRETLHSVDTRAKWQDEDVEPGEQESDWPRKADEQQEPDEGPDEPRTQLSGSLTLATSHDWARNCGKISADRLYARVSQPERVAEPD